MSNLGPHRTRRVVANPDVSAMPRCSNLIERALLAPGQTFFDYSNEPALYFLMNRTPPIRHGIVPFYEPEAKQREVIAALERIKPPLAILSGGSFDAPDAISNRDRTPLVATYLDRAYEPVAKVAGRTLARRRIP